MMIWNNDKVANPKIPSPRGYGWMEEDNDWVPVMTTELPAPDAVIHLIKCGCIKSKCSTKQCQCRNADLSCSDLCSCSDSGNECINVQNVNV